MIKRVLLVVALLSICACGAEDPEGDPRFYSTAILDAGGGEDAKMICIAPEDLEDAGAPRTCVYAREETTNAVYVNPTFDTFEMTVEYEDRSDQYRLSAYEVGEMAHWMWAVHALMGLDNNDEVKQRLSKGHWVVTTSNEIFGQLYNEEGDAGEIIAFINPDEASDACWEVPSSDEAHWSSAIQSAYWRRDNVDVVVHEMTHVVALATYGDSDGDHVFPDMWEEFGEESLQAIVINIHDRQYFPARFVVNMSIDPP